jgi:hypothetical protein
VFEIFSEMLGFYVGGLCPRWKAIVEVREIVGICLKGISRETPLYGTKL